MPGFKSDKKRLLFAGAGHSHLYSLARLEKFTNMGAAVTVISPSPFWYSGMGPGLLSGQYEPKDARVDVKSMVEKQGGRFIDAQVIKIEADKHYVITSDGSKLPYDLLSLNIGSEVASVPVNTGQENIFAVKPVSNFLEMRKYIQNCKSGQNIRISIAGGGPAGCEAAAAARALCINLGYNPLIRLFTGRSSLLAGLPSRSGKYMAEWCRNNGIIVEQTGRLSEIDGNTLIFENDSRSEADMAVLATGVHPPDILKQSELATDDEGALLVNDHLQSISNPEVFGGGDCIRIQARPLARVGVYAVRQGPFLFANLFSLFSGGRMRAFSPRKKFIQILNLSDKTGLLVRGNFVMPGRIAYFIKQWLDRLFIRQFQSAASRIKAK